MIDSVIAGVHSLLLGNLPIRHTKTPSGWITFDCVMCNDKRKRAGISQQGVKITYNCFNCGYKTGWTPAPYLGKKYKDVAERLGADKSQIHTVQMDLLKHSDQLEDAELDGNITFSNKQFDTVELPEDALSLDDLPANHELVKYAKQRGIFGLYPLLHFPDILNKRRVVVPFMFNNELVGWTGRHIAPPDKSTAKYLHKMPQGGYVFNIDQFTTPEREIVIVVEGIFDAILVDGVSIMGNKVTAEQAHLIERLGKRVIVCPDRDEAGKELIKQSIALGWEVSFPPWASDIKDAADACATYGRLATVASIIKHATNNDIKKEVMMRMT